MFNFIKSLFKKEPEKGKTIIDYHPDFLDWKEGDEVILNNGYGNMYRDYYYCSVSDKYIELRDYYGEHYYFNYKAVYYNKSLYKRNQQAIHDESTEFYKLLKKSYDEEIIRHSKEKNL